MPGGLDHINLWLLEDDDGWTVVDTCVPSDEAKKIWEKLFEGFMGGKPVTRVIVTHYHGDHVGLAGWLTERFSAPLWMTRTEYLFSKMNMFGGAGRGNDLMQGFFKSAGVSQERLESMRHMAPPDPNSKKKQPAHRRGPGAQYMQPTEGPQTYRRMQDGDMIRIGANRWEVVVGSGHSPEHACLYCPTLNVLISGDQILPRITSNVSVSFMEPEADPLRDWLESLSHIRTRLPADPLVLPAHNLPFYGLHSRISALIDRHETAMARLYELCATPQTVVDIFPAVFDKPIIGPSLFPATGEGLAHLNCLIYRGKIVRETDADGVNQYRQADIHDEANMDPDQIFE